MKNPYRWYDSVVNHNRIALVFLVADIIITFIGYPVPYLTVVVIPMLVLGFPLGSEIWNVLSSLVRERLGKIVSQRFSSYLGYGIALSSSLVYILTFIESSYWWGFVAAPVIQGFGLAIARHEPALFNRFLTESIRSDLVETLDEVAERFRIDTESQTAFLDLDRLVKEGHVLDPITMRLYEEEGIWVRPLLKKRWREKKIGGISTVTGLWKDIVHLRSLLREFLKRRTKLDLIPERESIYVEMARLPDDEYELIDLALKLSSYLDDFDSGALQRLTGSPPPRNDGSKFLRVLLKHLDATPSGNPVDTWMHIRNIRHGLAHAGPKGPRRKFYAALKFLDLTPSSLHYEPKSSWLRITKAYRDSLYDIVDTLQD